MVNQILDDIEIVNLNHHEVLTQLILPCSDSPREVGVEYRDNVLVRHVVLVKLPDMMRSIRFDVHLNLVF